MNSPNQFVRQSVVDELREQVNSQYECMCKCVDVMDRLVYLLGCVIEGQEIDRTEFREVANDASTLSIEMGGP